MQKFEWKKKQWIYSDNITIIEQRINRQRVDKGNNKFIQRFQIDRVMKLYARVYKVDLITASDTVKKVLGTTETEKRLLQLQEELNEKKRN